MHGKDNQQTIFEMASSLTRDITLSRNSYVYLSQMQISSYFLHKQVNTDTPNIVLRKYGKTTSDAVNHESCNILQHS